ncbi:response regulator [Bacillus taeanensis]|uniref:Two-component system response regulator n=1 Tax=Bacillus taeanensis TaxID=273032 RepID=A0A366XNU3_9BACI|nr:response regulator [Bacillus taeanensis]RBW68030.1 two-component system response regulator [Bacillus taeanensis]
MSVIEVLIVEDDQRIAEINRRFTEKIPGYQVSGIASNFEEGKELLEILQPDLVLLDVYFPDGNGIDLLWHIRQHYRTTDVMMITAAKEAGSVQEAIRGGAIDYIIKPIIFERFKNTLQRYQDYRSKIEGREALDQKEVDGLFYAVRESVTEVKNIPKGIDPLTLEKIEKVLTKYIEEGKTAEDLGQIVGVSRTTARRYLEYLVSTGAVRADLSYGAVGRPERRYFTLHS